MIKKDGQGKAWLRRYLNKEWEIWESKKRGIRRCRFWFEVIESITSPQPHHAGLLAESWRNRKKSVLLDQRRSNRWNLGNRNHQMAGYHEDFNFDEDQRPLEGSEQRSDLTWPRSFQYHVECVGIGWRGKRLRKDTGQKAFVQSRWEWLVARNKLEAMEGVVKFWVIFWKIAG